MHGGSSPAPVGWRTIKQTAGEETMRALGRTVLMVATLMLLSHMAAADIRVLSVGAVQNAVRTLVAQHEKDSGQRVVLTVGSPAVVLQKIKAGEIFDALIASEGAMDELD